MKFLNLLVCFTIVVIFNLTPTHLRTVNFKLEQYNFCPKVKKLAAFHPNTSIQIVKGTLEVLGSGTLTEDIKKPLDISIKSMRCDSAKNCVDENTIVIPRVCSFLKFVPGINQGFGDFFTPKLRCPVKAGDYSVNFSVPLTMFGVLPIPPSLRKIEIKFSEVFGPSRKRTALCLGGLVRTQTYSQRKN